MRIKEDHPYHPLGRACRGTFFVSSATITMISALRMPTIKASAAKRVRPLPRSLSLVLIHGS